VTADFPSRRAAMVENQIARRGIRSPAVLAAMREVPREAFVPESLAEFAYDDTPLPIAGGQTISQPYIVATMIEALGLKGGERVLEVGTGSGYAAAVLSRIARDVCTMERIGQLAEKAAGVLSRLGYVNVHVRHGDGTLGWSEHAPFDAIVVAAGGPTVPIPLKYQLKVGGRLVVPIGPDTRTQELVRVTRVGPDSFEQEDLADVRFVPLIGAAGWGERGGRTVQAAPSRAPLEPLAAAVREAVEPFDDIDTLDFRPLLARIGDARIVLLGESTHGSSEFYRFRDRLSRALIESRGFKFVAIEGDWPDAARIDHYVRHANAPPSEWTAFARFPTWMWRNREVQAFVDWLHQRNAHRPPAERVAFHGLDLYSLFHSIRSVLEYLERVDPETARAARLRYACLTPWESDPAVYGSAALTGAYRSCEREVVAMLADLMRKRPAYIGHDGERFLDAVQNAKLVADAERYYRTMYYGSRASWNLRDRHMFETLEALLDHHGSRSKAIVWAHNSHVGYSSATEMSARGEYNIGQLCRDRFGDGVYAVGFGTHRGMVAAATEWDGPMEIKRVRAAEPGSYEALFHAVGLEQWLLPLRHGAPPALTALAQPRLQRAIGVVYRPHSELASHYFQAALPQQFDEYVWFDETRAVAPLATVSLHDVGDTYPFGV
jgi:protein-L-isoaspartate(D-aspartate) O-methyltransferase